MCSSLLKYIMLMFYGKMQKKTSFIQRLNMLGNLATARIQIVVGQCPPRRTIPALNICDRFSSMLASAQMDAPDMCYPKKTVK